MSLCLPAMSFTRHLVSARLWMSQFVSNTTSTGAVFTDRETGQMGRGRGGRAEKKDQTIVSGGIFELPFFVLRLCGLPWRRHDFASLRPTTRAFDPEYYAVSSLPPAFEEASTTRSTLYAVTTLSAKSAPSNEAHSCVQRVCTCSNNVVRR